MKQSIQPVQAAGLFLRLLVGRQAELLAELNSTRDHTDGLREPVPEADQPAAAQSSSITQRLSAIESTELGRVNEALKKIRTGTYGVCESCRSSIPLARLKVIPWAERCRDCEAPAPQERLEEAGRV